MEKYKIELSGEPDVLRKAISGPYDFSGKTVETRYLFNGWLVTSQYNEYFLNIQDGDRGGLPPLILISKQDFEFAKSGRLNLKYMLLKYTKPLQNKCH